MNRHEIHQFINLPNNLRAQGVLVSGFVLVVSVRDKKCQSGCCYWFLAMTLMTTEEKELLSRAANLMEELLETLEVAQDKQLVRDLKAALKEVDEGKTRSLDELVRELNLEDEVRS